jgi:predicted AAA+ superfamily ATPase
MLSHSQGALLKASRLASGLAVNAPTISTYVSLLTDLLLVRRLLPYHSNIGKRMVKSPKTYIRNTGVLHALLGIEEMTELLGPPILGPSWEGFTIENLLAAAPERTQAGFYRTAAGAEVDLVLDFGGKQGLWALEIKRSLHPKAERGFYHTLEDLKPKKAFMVYAGEERYPIGNSIEVIGLRALAEEPSAL